MIDLTGIWQAESYGTDGKSLGELDITQTGDFVTAISTTGGSSWHGRVERSILNASYIREGAAGKVILQVLQDGNVLNGTWSSNTGYTGTYIARRKSKRR